MPFFALTFSYSFNRLSQVNQLTLINTWIHILAKSIIPIRCILPTNVGPKMYRLTVLKSRREYHYACAKTEQKSRGSRGQYRQFRSFTLRHMRSIIVYST